MPTCLGRRFLALALAPLALLAVPSAASTAGLIVIHGAQSGSRLSLDSEGGRLVVRGKMAASHPAGCHLSGDHMVAICPFRQAAEIELDMGPSGDLVNVADPMPVPITAYLGPGSDKMIGNDEPDTCYSQGSRRNRCIGGGGNDVCITGEKNSDCVGGAGNDYCKTSDGSDGCFMGPGEDGCHGDSGNDRLYGGADPDQLYGGTGFDYCNGGPGRGKSHACNTGPGH
jgi:Ca2+-binding RTX toxin-like protein